VEARADKPIFNIRHLHRSLADIFGPFGVSFASFAFSQMLEPLTPKSTAAVAGIRTHAGICKVKRYVFDMP
jgi:hypothetical protein